MRSLGPDFAKDLDPGAAEMRPGDADKLIEFTNTLDEAEGFMTTLLSYDPYDVRLFREFYDASEELRGLSEDSRAPKTFGPLLMDLFLEYFKVTPTRIEVSGVEPGHLRANGPFLERIMTDNETMITRISTCLDELLSGQATIEAGQAFLEEISNRPELNDWMEDQAKHRENDPESPQEPQETLEPGAKEEPDPSLQEVPQKVHQQVPQKGSDQDSANNDDGSHDSEKDQAQAAASPNAFDENLVEDTESPDEDNQNTQYHQNNQETSQADEEPPPPQDLTATVRAATSAGSNETTQLLAAISNWGFEPGDLKRVPLGERIELAKKLHTRRLKDLAKMLGRMKNTKRTAEKRKLRNDHGEKYSVTISGNLERTLPAERASAFGSGDEYRELDFYRKLSENKAPSYDLRTVEDVGRGPVIAMIDASTSMSGERMEWASSLALALAHPGTKKLAKSDRHLYAIFFNSRIVLEVEFLPGENDIQKLVSVGTVAPDGGTAYKKPMERAIEVASEMADRKAAKGHGRNKRAGNHRSRKRKTQRSKNTPADLLLITDGECKLPEDFTRDLLDQKRRQGFRIVSVLIGDNPRGPESLEPFSDLIIPVAYLGGSSADEAAKIFDALGPSKPSKP